jgi:hypothetical protein
MRPGRTAAPPTITRVTGLLEDVLAAQPDPPATTLVATLAVAALLVAYAPAWRLLRHVVTIAHEGGHAAVASLTGRSLQGVRLHSDTSGLTVSSGRPRGAGVVLTLLAGYPAPALIGLAAAFALSAGRVRLTLVGALLLLLALLLQIRNVFGVVSVVATGGALLAVAGWAPDGVQAAAAYLLTWFLLLGAPRTLVELQGSRRRRRGRTSDVDQLADLTRVPAIVWLVVMAAAAVGALGLAVVWLLAP